MTKLIEAPERIHGWRDTQLSIARFYGGLIYQGKHYVIAHEEEGAPLVRHDVYVAKLKAKRSKEKKDAVGSEQKLNF